MSASVPGVIIDGAPIMSPAEHARAIELCHEWDRYRHGLPSLGPRLAYPTGSIGDGYQRAMAMREKARKAKGIVWAREHHRGVHARPSATTSRHANPDQD